MGRSGSSTVESDANSVILSGLLVGRMKGLKMKRLNRMGPIMGILEGQQWVSSGSGPL